MISKPTLFSNVMAGEGTGPSPLMDVPELDTEHAAHSQTAAESGPYLVRGAGGL